METNRLKRAWIWFWYNDFTRFCVLFGLPVIPAVAVTAAIFGTGEYLGTVAIAAYVVPVALAIIDNDYSNLRRIGMDECRRKLKRKAIK